MKRYPLATPTSFDSIVRDLAMTNVKLFNLSAVIVLTAMLVFTSGCVSNSAGETEQNEITKLKKENALLKRQISLMRRQLRLSANQRQPVFRPRVQEGRIGTNPPIGNTKATIALID